MKSYLIHLTSLGGLLLALMIGIGFAGRFHPAFDSFSHFRFHFAVLAILAGLILLILGGRMRGLLVLLAAMIGFAGPGQAFFQINIEAITPGGIPFVVVQHNLRFNNSRLPLTASVLTNADADVIVLEEVSYANAALLKTLAPDYPHQTAICPFSRYIGGIAILSRHPFTGDHQGCVDGQGLAWVQVDVAGVPVTVAGMHLHWPWPSAQHAQVTRLGNQLAALPHPLLIAGDFNAASWSHTTNRIGTLTRTKSVPDLHLTWMAPEFGLPVALTGLPLDQILISDAVTYVGSWTLNWTGSDHLPVKSVLSLSAPTSSPAISE